MMQVETKKLTVGYSGKPLISGIDLGVEKGRIVTLIGPNGSGKSTILKTITRHLEKIAGVVMVDQRKIEKWSNKELAQRMSVMLTERVMPELMTCHEVVALGRYPYTNAFGKLNKKDEIDADNSDKAVLLRAAWNGLLLDVIDLYKHLENK